MMRQFSSSPFHAHEGLARRPGTVLVLIAFCMVALLGFLALSIDIGMLAIAKTQSQGAADLAALTAARTLNGTSTASSYNNAAATANSQAILSYNVLLGQPIQASQVALTYGSYDYNQTTQAFTANFPPTNGVPWTAVTATVTSTNLPGAFSKVFGTQFLPNVTSTAQAVHRPRDIALVMDLSVSMRFGTLLGYDFSTPSRTTNNPDPLVPTFGPYSSSSSVMTGPNTNTVSATENYTITPSNTTAPNASYSLTYINSFYQNAAYATTLIRAFDSYTSADAGTTWAAPGTGAAPQLPPASFAKTPGGDVPLFQSGSTTTYAQTVNQVLGLASSNTAANIMWELDGYSAYAAGKPDTSGTNYTPQVWAQADYSKPASPPVNGSLPFNGYTKGPGYYGKTFFLWPPDPRNTNVVSGTTLTGYLTALGVSTTGSPSDVTTLASMWATWQGQGAAGLANLQSWLQQGSTATNGDKANLNYYTSTANGAYVGGSSAITWNGWTAAPAPKTYYAVCRLFNRAYPGGTAWTSTPFSADWRTRFFGVNTTFNGTNYGDTYLFNSSGALNAPGSNGTWPGSGGTAASALLTYNAVLSWLTATSDPFPTQMRSGRIKYYGSIPTSITGTWPSYGSTDQRFWVEFIDHVLGFRQTAAATYMDISGINAANTLQGYGADFAWGTVSITAPPTATPQPYMNYQDNPGRPLLRFWFSPLLMVDFLHQCNLYENSGSFGAQLPGNYFLMEPADAYVAPLYTAKQAYVAAVNTMQTNHPNDWFTTLSYSQPRVSASDPNGRLNNVHCPLGTNYKYGISSLLFPYSTINADGSANNTEVTPYDADAATGTIPSANFLDAPRASGDTCFAMGLMLAYNQFAVTPVGDNTLRSYVSSSPINFPTGMAGGMGRKGAQKVIIFETDGLANCMATANLVTNGTYSYYEIRYDMNHPSSAEYPTVSTQNINNSSVLNQVNTLVQQLATTYGSSRNPFRLYAIGFGPVFQGPDASSGLSTLQTMQFYAGTQSSASTPLASNQIITGTDSQMTANMISAYRTILQSGVQIALIK